MKLYKCQMLDESMPDWEECIVAVMENQTEQDFYYKDKFTARKTLFANSGYSYDDYYIEFWFPYEKDGLHYADEIAKNIPQCVWGTDYANFELIEPQADHNKAESEDKK